MSKTVAAPVICQICKKPKPPHSGMIAELIRPSLLEFIQKKLPDLDSSGFICLDDLGEFRKDYIKEVLQDEIGELSVLDNEVIESLHQHEILASNIEEQFERKLTFGKVVRSDSVVWRQLEIYHPLRRRPCGLDHFECRSAREPRVRPVSIHSAKSDPLMSRRHAGANHHDESKSRRAARSFALGERLQNQSQSRARDSALARKNRSPFATAIQSAIRD